MLKSGTMGKPNKISEIAAIVNAETGTMQSVIAILCRYGTILHLTMGVFSLLCCWQLAGSTIS